MIRIKLELHEVPLSIAFKIRPENSQPISLFTGIAYQFHKGQRGTIIMENCLYQDVHILKKKTFFIFIFFLILHPLEGTVCSQSAKINLGIFHPIL